MRAATSTAADYRHDVSLDGVPAGTSPRSPDQVLVDLDGVTLDALPRLTEACRAPTNAANTAPGTELIINAGAVPVEVAVRRFGNALVSVGTVPAESAGVLQSRTDGTTIPWVVSAKAHASVVVRSADRLIG